MKGKDAIFVILIFLFQHSVLNNAQHRNNIPEFTCTCIDYWLLLLYYGNGETKLLYMLLLYMQAYSFFVLLCFFVCLLFSDIINLVPSLASPVLAINHRIEHQKENHEKPFCSLLAS